MLRVSVFLAVALIAGPVAAQERQSPDDTLYLVAIDGPDVHLRSAPFAQEGDRLQFWWWHFGDSDPGAAANGEAFLMEVDCTAHTRRMLRAELFHDMDFVYVQPLAPTAEAQPNAPHSLARTLERSACEGTYESEPFVDPEEAFLVSQEYFRTRNPD